jgi:hypothetical protein
MVGMRRLLITAALTGALLLTGAGCGSSSPSSSSNKPGAAASASVDRDEALRKYAQCMRDHGIRMDDPEPGSALKVTDPGGDPQKLKDASDACRSLLPNGGQLNMDDPATIDKLQKFTQCMREHGVNIPDPDPNGGGGITFDKNSGIDPESQTFKDAMEACKSLRPGQ